MMGKDQQRNIDKFNENYSYNVDKSFKVIDTVVPVEDRKEIEADTSKIQAQAQELAQLLQSSKKCVVFTGAGISTSANIPDYRGPDGAWTRVAEGRSNERIEIDWLNVNPTYSHFALAKLCDEGLIDLVVSTNIDCLHLRSGLNPEKLVEIHGNLFKLYCPECLKEYYQDTFIQENSSLKSNHQCPCGGNLLSSSIKFGMDLIQEMADRCTKECWEADLHIVIGSSLTEHRHSTLPHYVDFCRKDTTPLVILNLQKTAFDDASKLRVFGKTDVFFKFLMAELNLAAPKEGISIHSVVALSPLPSGESNRFFKPLTTLTLGIGMCLMLKYLKKS